MTWGRERGRRPDERMPIAKNGRVVVVVGSLLIHSSPCYWICYWIEFRSFQLPRQNTLPPRLRIEQLQSSLAIRTWAAVNFQRKQIRRLTAAGPSGTYSFPRRRRRALGKHWVDYYTSGHLSLCVCVSFIFFPLPRWTRRYVFLLRGRLFGESIVARDSPTFAGRRISQDEEK